MAASESISRRALFRRLFRRDTRGSGAPYRSVPPNQREVAVIQGRYCLAYTDTYCSTCIETCPELGAIISEGGIPHVVPDHCTGCGLCHDLCPAPTNAILMVKPRDP